MLQKQLNDSNISFVTSHRKCCPPVITLDISICTMLQKQVYDVVMTFGTSIQLWSLKLLSSTGDYGYGFIGYGKLHISHIRPVVKRIMITSAVDPVF